MEKRDQQKHTKKERSRSSGSGAGSPPVSPPPPSEQQAPFLSSSSSVKPGAPDAASGTPVSPLLPTADTRSVAIKPEEHVKGKYEGQKPSKGAHHSRLGAGKPAPKAGKLKSPRPSEARASRSRSRSRSRSSSSSSVSSLTSSSSLASLDGQPGGGGRRSGAPLARKHNKKRRRSSGKHKRTRRTSPESAVAQTRGSSDADGAIAAAEAAAFSPEKPAARASVSSPLGSAQEVTAPQVAKKRWLRQSFMSTSGVLERSCILVQ